MKMAGMIEMFMRVATGAMVMMGAHAGQILRLLLRGDNCAELWAGQMPGKVRLSISARGKVIAIIYAMDAVKIGQPVQVVVLRDRK